MPDDGVLLPALEGAGLALLDTVEGLYRLVFHTGETVEGLVRLPGAARSLIQNAPEYWEVFRHKPHGEQVRGVSRVITGVLLVVGTSGEGAVQAATWGSRLGRFALPVFSLTGRGELALRRVAVPGRVVTVAGQALSATYVLHMAAVGVGVGGGGWTPPVGGPGQWIQKNEGMSPRARKYQSQVTGRPAGWVYRVYKNGKKADFDDYRGGVLVDAKGIGYDKFFDKKLAPKDWFQGADGIIERAQRQSYVANGVLVRWHVAEARMVPILKKLFQEHQIQGIELLHTPPLPRPA